MIKETHLFGGVEGLGLTLADENVHEEGLAVVQVSDDSHVAGKLGSSHQSAHELGRHHQLGHRRLEHLLNPVGRGGGGVSQKAGEVRVECQNKTCMFERQKDSKKKTKREEKKKRTETQDDRQTNRQTEENTEGLTRKNTEGQTNTQANTQTSFYSTW